MPAALLTSPFCQIDPSLAILERAASPFSFPALWLLRQLAQRRVTPQSSYHRHMGLGGTLQEAAEATHGLQHLEGPSPEPSDEADRQCAGDRPRHPHAVR